MLNIISMLCFLIFFTISTHAQGVKVEKPEPVRVRIEKTQPETTEVHPAPKSAKPQETAKSLRSIPRSTVVIEKGEIVRTQIEKKLPERVSVAPREAVAPSRILSPAAGEVVRKVIKVQGIVTRLSGPAWLQINDVRQPVKVNENGSFEETAVLTGGDNRIVLGAGTDTLNVVRVRSEAPRSSLRVQLGWDTDNSDIDLYVIQPDGEAVWFQHMTSGLGGTLDVDNTRGFGPEHYTLISAVPGVFRIYVHYFANHGHLGPVPYHVTIFKNDQPVDRCDGFLTRPSIGSTGPRNVGHDDSWRHVADVSVP